MTHRNRSRIEGWHVRHETGSQKVGLHDELAVNHSIS
jgi:hypothetical protein